MGEGGGGGGGGRDTLYTSWLPDPWDCPSGRIESSQTKSVDAGAWKQDREIFSYCYNNMLQGTVCGSH